MKEPQTIQGYVVDSGNPAPIDYRKVDSARLGGIKSILARASRDKNNPDAKLRKF